MGLLLLALPLVAQSDEPLPLYALPAGTPARTASSLVFLPTGRLAVADPLTDTVALVEPATGTIEQEITVGRDPRSLMLTEDNTRLLVVNRGEGTLSVIDLAAGAVTATYPLGTLPVNGVLCSATTACIALQGAAQIIVLDINDGRIITRIDTPPFPTGLARWGDFVYVTHFWTGDLSLIYLPAGRVVQTLATGRDSGLSASLELDTRAGLAYLPQSRLNADLPQVPFDARVLPVVQVVDLATMQVRPELRLELNLIDRPVHLPFTVRLNTDRDRLYVLNAGSDDLSVIDLDTRRGAGFVRLGANPRAMLFSRDGQSLLVHNTLDSTLSVVSLRFLNVQDNYPVTLQTVPLQTRIGARLFHTATDPRLSAGSSLSCAACHFDGLSDGRVWEGFNTPLLADLANTLPPYGWIGTWGDLTALEEHVRLAQAGTGLRQDVVDFDALLAYVRALPATASPYQQPAELIQRGAAVFAGLQCATCHSGERGSDGRAYDVGTGGRYRTPPLRGLWLSAPYLHHGAAATLRDVFTTGQGTHRLPASVPDADVAALLAYLLSR
jgi:YVTN family beta-propeller protein